MGIIERQLRLEKVRKARGGDWAGAASSWLA
jgi:hypothetical protein